MIDPDEVATVAVLQGKFEATDDYAAEMSMTYAF
jgi:hypothetical protein